MLIDMYASAIEDGDCEAVKYIDIALEAIAILTSDEYVNITENKITYSLDKDDIMEFLNEFKEIKRINSTDEEYEKFEENINNSLSLIEACVKKFNISSVSNKKGNEYIDGNDKVVIDTLYQVNKEKIQFTYDMNLSFKSTNKDIYITKFTKEKNVSEYLSRAYNQMASIGYFKE